MGLAAINCAQLRNIPLCNKHGVIFFPTIKTFAAGSVESTEIKDYQQCSDEIEPNCLKAENTKSPDEVAYALAARMVKFIKEQQEKDMGPFSQLTSLLRIEEPKSCSL